jgi:hypothetical protein
MSNEMAITELLPVAPKSNFSRVDHLTIGLSPTYWTHVPICICQLHSLRLEQGVSCLVQELDGQEKLIPISRCCLVGSIVSVERTSASVLYVIDDGTGLVDCVFWLDRDIYTLPSLFEDTGDGILQVGEIVRVLGRIECVAVRSNGSAGMTNNNNTKIAVRDADTLVSSDAIREIHASVVEPLTASPATRAMPHTLDAESQHWINCVSPSSALSNAADVLELLGPEIRAQVDSRSNFSAAADDDYSGAWRVFGMDCRCELAYKDALLYCHCQATPELLDPEYRYRDALLLTLLDMEKVVASTGSSEISTHLRFQYRTVAGHSRLLQIASDEVAKSGGPISNAQRLVVSTFRALRQDGILYLLDEQSDTYLFVSRSKVLDPYIQKMQSTSHETAVERTHLQNNRPAYLSKVPKARLQFIRKDLLSHRQSNV